jgi:hypothetical protein
MTVFSIALASRLPLCFSAVLVKKTDQNQDSFSLETLPPPSVPKGSLKIYVAKTTDQ